MIDFFSVRLTARGDGLREFDNGRIDRSATTLMWEVSAERDDASPLGKPSFK